MSASRGVCSDLRRTFSPTLLESMATCTTELLNDLQPAWSPAGESAILSWSSSPEHLNRRHEPWIPSKSASRTT